MADHTIPPPQALGFRLTEAEFIKAHRFHLRRSLLTGKNLIFVTIALGLAALQANVLGSSGEAMTVFVGLWIGVLSFLVFAYVALPGRLYRRDPRFSEPHQLVFSAEELTYRTGESAQVYRWDELKRLAESRNFLFIYPEHGLPIIAPKSAMPEGAIHDIRRWIHPAQ